MTLNLAKLPEGGLDLDELLSDLEGELMAQAVERTGGNIQQAAHLLRLKRTTLVERLRRHREGRARMARPPYPRADGGEPAPQPEPLEAMAEGFEEIDLNGCLDWECG